MAVRADMIDIEDLDQRVFVPAARDELRHLAQTLNAMLDRIKDGVAAKERLIADTSHELRGPLAAMRAELDVSLRHDDLDPQARALLESQREEVARLARIVDNLLTLARIDEGHLALMQSPNDVLALAQRAVRAHCATADRAGVALLASGERVEVSCDPDRIGQVLGNLLDNAVRVSPPGETVDVRVTREGEEARIEVSDRGPGVPAPERERIFERFARLDAARSRDAGAGLGLAICREVVAAHGGRLELAEPDGTGSTFVVTLPTAGPLTAPVSSH
jgi:signal transduction histidine kinase